MLPDVICCKPLVNGKRSLTALALMRSRYSAFVWKDAIIRIDTTKQRPVTPVSLSAVTWTGLHILSIENGRPTDSTGTVNQGPLHGEWAQGCPTREVG